MKIIRIALSVHLKTSTEENKLNERPPRMKIIRITLSVHPKTSTEENKLNERPPRTKITRITLSVHPKTSTEENRGHVNDSTGSSPRDNAPVRTAHLEKMHGIVIHPHQSHQTGSLLGSYIVGMQRKCPRETSIP